MTVACGSCDFFIAPKAAPEGADASHPVFNFGRCKRFPPTVEKNASDWCGEYSHGRFQKEGTTFG
jgi:hypothetical protein